MVAGVDAITHRGGVPVGGRSALSCRPTSCVVFNLYEAAGLNGVEHLLSASSNGSSVFFYRQDQSSTADHPARPNGCTRGKAFANNWRACSLTVRG